MQRICILLHGSLFGYITRRAFAYILISGWCRLVCPQPRNSGMFFFAVRNLSDRVSCLWSKTQGLADLDADTIRELRPEDAALALSCMVNAHRAHMDEIARDSTLDRLTSSIGIPLLDHVAASANTLQATFLVAALDAVTYLHQQHRGPQPWSGAIAVPLRTSTPPALVQTTVAYSLTKVAMAVQPGTHIAPILDALTCAATASAWCCKTRSRR